uniref:Peptidase S1 domain-containing protein n=1 Tax=Anopheles christyi TaxID=43041 RepID=A0A182JYJ0_9DIPT
MKLVHWLTIIGVGALVLVTAVEKIPLINQYRFTAAIAYNANYTANGVILNGKWVLSLASVFANGPDTDYQVLIGSPKFLEGATVYVKRVIKHPEFDGLANDIAMVEMDHILLETVNAASVDLAINDVDSAAGTMASFGVGDELRESLITLTTDDGCVGKLDDAHKKIVKDGLAYCVVSVNGDVNEARDIGAPIVSASFLHGLLASGGVATRVPRYRTWILSTINDNVGR